MNYAFVILHYNNIHDTKQAVSSILKLQTKENDSYEIVIVDNHSPNQSGEELKHIYEKMSRVTVVLNDKNIGFARGNNVGYEYARNVLHASCIIAMNNDIMIPDRFFLCKIEKYLNDAEIIAPDIVGKKGTHQNPFRKTKITDRELEKIYSYFTRVSKIYKLPAAGHLLAAALDVKGIVFPKKKCREKNICRNIVPHGACIVYTRRWIEKEEIAFVPKTFMYFEEDILMEYIINRQYATLYCPELAVVHKEDASAKESFASSRKRRGFISEHMKDSIKILIDMRKEAAE